jgi:uncharacterized damage-inducible protein DinB
MTGYGGAELARSSRTVRRNTLIIAEEIPENRYDFRPAPESRSVRETLAHILVTSEGTYGGYVERKVTTFTGVDLRTVIADRLAREQKWATASKRELLEALRHDGEIWGAYLERVADAELAVTVTFPEGAQPPAKSRFEIFLSHKEHEMHHRAQLMVIERMLGLVPHLTRERAARLGPPDATRR